MCGLPGCCGGQRICCFATKRLCEVGTSTSNPGKARLFWVPHEHIGGRVLSRLPAPGAKTLALSPKTETHIRAQRPQRDQGPIFWQPNSTLPGCSLPVYDHHLLVIFASFCADSIPAMVAPPRRPRLRCAGCALPVRSEIGPYQPRHSGCLLALQPSRQARFLPVSPNRLEISRFQSLNLLGLPKLCCYRLRGGLPHFQPARRILNQRN